VQSDYGCCNYGALFDALLTIDYLITKLKDLKQQQYYQPRSHFKASINLGWKKLNKYYLLSNKIAAYRAAVVLYPYRKMAWFKKH